MVDDSALFKAMVHSAQEDRFGLDAYKRDGFIDASQEAEGVSRTLEYAYDDWTIAQVAMMLVIEIGLLQPLERYLFRWRRDVRT